MEPPDQSEALLPSRLEGGCKLRREEHALRREDLGSPTVGEGVDPEASASELGVEEGERLFVQKANTPPDPKSGACFSSGDRCAQPGEPAFCFLGNSVSSRPGNFHQPRPSARGAVPEPRERSTAERRACLPVSREAFAVPPRGTKPKSIVLQAPTDRFLCVSRMELGACGKSFKVEIFS